MRWRRKQSQDEKTSGFRRFWNDVLAAHDGDEVVSPTGMTLIVKRPEKGQTCRDCALGAYHESAKHAGTLHYDFTECRRIREIYGIGCKDVPCDSFSRGVGKYPVLLVKKDGTD